MIKNWGEDWRYDAGSWGRASKRTKAVNFRKQCGIYVLFKGGKAVYVGLSCKGEGASIFKRVYAHRRNKKWRGKWDTFS